MKPCSSVSLTRQLLFGAGLICSFAVSPARADTLDFETGYLDGQKVNVFTSTSNTLTINTTGGKDISVAQVGDPVTAFRPHDTPGAGGEVIGDYFLTDGLKGRPKRNNFELDFDSAVDQLSLNIIDLGIKGRSAVLKACTDASCSNVEKQVEYEIPDRDFKGLVSFLDLGTFGAVTHFELEFLSKNGKRTPVDVGLGLDNFTFHTADIGGGGTGGGTNPVPEPASLALLGSSVLGLGLKRRRKSA
jgi:hypothetical protein